MEEYFYEQQEVIKEMLEKIKNINVSKYHESIAKAKTDVIKALETLYEEFEF